MKVYRVLDGIGSGCTASVITALAAIGIASGIGILNNFSLNNDEVDKRVTGVLQTAGVIVSVGLAGAVVSGFLYEQFTERDRLLTENKQLKQQLLEVEKDHDEKWQEWRKELSKQRQTWEALNYKLLKNMDKLRIADSEKDYKINQLKQELEAYQQQLAVKLFNNFDELN